jgi:hypothetical protein
MWTPAKTKAARKEQIKELLRTNDRAVQRGVLAIYKRQTEAEQDTLSTKENNGVGFNGLDAEIMSSFAQRINRGISLTEKQMVYARKIILKYSGQLMAIADARTGVAA